MTDSPNLPAPAQHESPLAVLKQMHVWWLLLFPFVSLTGYAIARPSIETLFIEAYSTKGLPYGWLAIAFAALATVNVYNRALRRYSLGHIIPRASGIFAMVLLALWLAVRLHVPGAEFLLYVWKDTYIVVLVEIFWSFANATFALKSASWLYGTFCAVGAAGGVMGSWLVGFLSKSVGALNTPIFALPSLVLCGLIGWALQGQHDVKKEAPDSQTKSKGSFSDSLGILKRSDYLISLLLIIMLIQVVLNLIDFQFHSFIKSLFPDPNLRQTQVAMVYGYVEGIAFILQITTFATVRLLGIGGTLRSVPLLLAAGLLGFAFFPSFLLMASVKVASKSLDYSLNRAVKEMLYLPLSIEEKTAGKSIVDILTYRMSKGLASVLVIAFTTFGVHFKSITWVNLFLIALWLIVVGIVIRKYHRLIARQNHKQQLLDNR